MKMKRIAAMLLAGAMLTGLCACGGSGGGDDKKAAGSGGGSADGAKISMILKTTSAEYWQYVQAGAEAAAKDLGVTVDVKGATSETAYDEQQNMIETDVQSGAYDSIIIAPLQGDQAATLVKGTKTPIFAVDTNFDAPEVVSFIGTGNEDAAAQGGKAAVEAAKAAGWEKIECIEICGVQGDPTNTARYEGYKKGVNEAGGTFLEKETQYADAVADKAVNSMEAIMQTHPEGVAIICANNDDMACAAAKAAKGNKAYEKTIFLGFDGSTSACQAVLDGSLTLTCAQQPYDMGYKACETAVKAAKGESVDNVDTGTEIIEKDNAQARIDKMNEYLAKIK